MWIYYTSFILCTLIDLCEVGFIYINTRRDCRCEKTLGIDLSGGTISVNVNSHGGFHGDGITYVEITLSLFFQFHYCYL